MATNALIVPLDVQALPIGTEDQPNFPLLESYADFSSLPTASQQAGPYLGSQVLAGSQPFQGGYVFPAGVHLHWSLPYALTNGRQTAPDTPLVYPSVPNRWLIVRMIVTVGQDAATPVAVVSTVVESDLLSTSSTLTNGMHQPTVPVTPSSAGPNFLYLGGAYDAATWTTQDGQRLTPFTAIGPGEATFAAYYPNCCASFGFLDTLSDYPAYDPATQAITYVVAGWYDTPANDPLNGGATCEQMSALGWQTSEGSTASQTLLAGAVTGVTWYASGTANITQTSGQPLTATVGTTASEALSAALAACASGADAGLADAEMVLNAMQCGLMPQTGLVADILPTLQETLHRAGFQSLSGGSYWTATPVNVQASAPAPPLGASLAELLAELNGLQADYDARLQEGLAQQNQLFALWNLFEATQYFSPVSYPLTGAQMQPLLQAFITQIHALQASVAKAATAVTNSANQLSDPMQAAGFSLQQGNGAEPYWRPLDPAIVLAGQDIAPLLRYTGTPLLPCRLSTQLFQTATFALDNDAAMTVAASDLTFLPQISNFASSGILPAPLLQAVLVDTVLSTPALGSAVVAALAAQGGASNPAITDPSGTFGAYITALTAYAAGSFTLGVTFNTGAVSPADAATTTWTSPPWMPILMQYSASFTALNPLVTPQNIASSLSVYPTNLLTSGTFTVGSNQADLTFTGSLGTESSTVTGQVILSGGAKNNLSAAIAAYISQSGAPDPEMVAVQTALDALPQLSQGVAGFGHSQIMQSPTLQMPVYDPTLASGDQATLLAQIALGVGSQTIAAPLPENDFNPLRTGLLTLNEIRLVDVFGRFYDYEDTNLTIACSSGVQPPASVNASAGQAFFAPRLNQPSRLLFNWAGPAGNVIDPAAPAASPIAGFVVLNLADESLDLYTASGTAAMTLAIVDGAVQATPPPLSPLGTAANWDQITLGLDPDLVAFAAAVSAQSDNGSAAYFQSLLQCIQTGLKDDLPASFQQSAALAALAGTPLALARAQLQLQQMGGPAMNQSWNAVQIALDGSDTGLDGGIGTVDVPVMLGAVSQLNDTLVGYFLNGQYSQFFSVAATEEVAGVTNAGLTTTVVQPGGPAVPVTLLLDPRGEVNATTGLLPVQTLQLPQSLYSGALASLSFAFRIGSLLTASNTGGVSMPMPTQSVGTWNWVAASATGSWQTLSPTDATSNLNSLSYSPQTAAEGWLVLQPADSETSTS